MTSDNAVAERICKLLRDVPRLVCHRMFGEYAIYVGDKVVALVCDNRLFVKPTAAGRKLLGEPAEIAPYPGGAPAFLVEGIEDGEFLVALFRATERELPEPAAE